MLNKSVSILSYSILLLCITASVSLAAKSTSGSASSPSNTIDFLRTLPAPKFISQATTIVKPLSTSVRRTTKGPLTSEEWRSLLTRTATLYNDLAFYYGHPEYCNDAILTASITSGATSITRSINRQLGLHWESLAAIYDEWIDAANSEPDAVYGLLFARRDTPRTMDRNDIVTNFRLCKENANGFVQSVAGMVRMANSNYADPRYRTLNDMYHRNYDYNAELGINWSNQCENLKNGIVYNRDFFINRMTIGGSSAWDPRPFPATPIE